MRANNETFVIRYFGRRHAQKLPAQPVVNVTNQLLIPLTRHDREKRVNRGSSILFRMVVVE